jgi:hypothetical protein
MGAFAVEIEVTERISYGPQSHAPKQAAANGDMEQICGRGVLCELSQDCVVAKHLQEEVSRRHGGPRWSCHH